MHRGQYLDDLVFVYHLIISMRIDELKPNLPYLINKIQELNQQIYTKNYSLKTINEAWLMRKYCPILLNTAYVNSNFAKCSRKMVNTSFVNAERTFNTEEWQDICENILYNDKNRAIELYLAYHNQSKRRTYEEIIEVDILEILNVENMILIQQKILQYMHDNEIVIESLPTSNMRIGHYSNYASYHLWNWINWNKQNLPVPPIVIGTDDAGIFATNIYNEYANIYCYLTNQCKLSHSDTLKVIERFNKDSQIYRFK